MKIEIISGSSRTESKSHRLALFLKKLLEERTEHEVGFINLKDWQFPHFEEVFLSLEKTPAEFKPVAQKIFEADAFVIVTPEYNGSYSPALKNFLDHFPKQQHKVFGIVTASTGALGGMRASQQLLLLIPALFGIASPYLLITPNVDKKFDESGNLLDQAFQKPIDIFINEFLWLAEKIHPHFVHLN
ncbi:MAG: NAD(P)H-dependent oxidoreductase [Chitinophagaceae bacterium]|nr:NAD(P)H-dependent oxidoreductase [Chitinophagaceae bacterium]